MRRIIAIAFCLTVFGLSNVYSQTVNDIPLKDIDVDYIQIVGTARFLSNKVTIEIDFGQENKFWSGKNARLRGEDGKPVILNSMIDALNFLSDNGYEFVNAYVITVGNQNVYHYMMKRKKEDQEFKGDTENLIE